MVRIAKRFAEKALAGSETLQENLENSINFSKET
jgi:hypothetical protein